MGFGEASFIAVAILGKPKRDLFRNKRPCPMRTPCIARNRQTGNCPDSPRYALGGSKGQLGAAGAAACIWTGCAGPPSNYGADQGECEHGNGHKAGHEAPLAPLKLASVDKLRGDFN